MDSQQVRDVFLEALAETSETDDSGLFAHIVCQLTGAIDITENVEVAHAVLLGGDPAAPDGSDETGGSVATGPALGCRGHWSVRLRLARQIVDMPIRRTVEG
jgi:hypothetical protein